MKFLHVIVIIMLSSSIAHGQLAHEEIAGTLPDIRKQGAADVRLFGLNLYRAELWTGGAGFTFETPFALSLIYKRDFTAQQLTRRTVEEIAKMEGVEESTHGPLYALETCFRNVQPGDRITGIALDDNRTRFFWNGLQTCDFTYPDFTRRFFGIWLDERTIDRRTRARLLGAT